MYIMMLHFVNLFLSNLTYNLTTCYQQHLLKYHRVFQSSYCPMSADLHCVYFTSFRSTQPISYWWGAVSINCMHLLVYVSIIFNVGLTHTHTHTHTHAHTHARAHTHTHTHTHTQVQWTLSYPNSLGSRPVMICEMFGYVIYIKFFIFSKGHDLARRANSLAFSS